jgi:phage gp36-like protein
MYLTLDDYKQLITSEDLDIVQQADETVRTNAETAAIEYFSGYLRGRYDVDALFARTGTDRDPVLVQFLIDAVLYTLHSSLPGNMMPEIRKERKDELDKWLLDVQKGIVQPDFPTLNTDEETDTGRPVKFGSNTKLNSTW